MEPVFFEKLIIKFLFNNLEVRDKVMPYLIPTIFEDHKNIQIVNKIIEFNEKYNKFPSFLELKIVIEQEEVYNQLKEILSLNTDEYKDEFLLTEIEGFFKSKLIWNSIVNTTQHLNNNDMSEMSLVPDQIREALAFSFDTEIGLDFLNSENRLYDALHNKDSVVKTGMSTFDMMIDGGFHEKSLSLFMAETNMGKTLVKCSLATNCLLQNKNVLYVTLEMSENKISERIMANLFDISMDDLKCVTRDKFNEKFQNFKKLLNNKLYIKEFPPSSINANHIRNLLKELKVKQKFIPDIIFIDYMELMIAIHSKKTDTPYHELKKISEEIRAIAVELEIPIVSAVQSNRKGFGKVEIDLTDISDSIGPAKTADVIIGITQSEEFRKMGKFSWMLLKNRYGINKRRIVVNVDYYKMRVYEDQNIEIEGNGNNIPPSPKEQQQQINNAISTVNNLAQKESEDKFKKMLDIDI